MFFFYIFMIIFFLLIGLIFSKIELHLKRVEFTNVNFKNSKINRNAIIKIKFYFYGIIKFFEIDLKKVKVNNKNIKQRISNIEEKINYKKSINIRKIVKYLNIKIKKLNLKINIDMEDSAVLSILVGIFSGIISCILPNISNKKSQIYWKIRPIYQNQYFFNISLNGIVTTNLIHIIYAIYMLNKGG